MKEVKIIYLQVLARYKKDWGTKHILTFNMVNNLGLLYLKKVKIKKAKVMFIQKLIRYKTA